MSEGQKSNKVFTQGTGFRVIDGNRKTDDVSENIKNLIGGDSLITNITLTLEQANDLLSKVDQVMQGNPESGKLQLAFYTSIRQGKSGDFLSSNISVTEVKAAQKKTSGYQPKQYGNKGASNGAADRANRVRREVGN